MAFDFAGFKRAFEAKDYAAWIGYYAGDAVWTEYRALNPPRDPNVMNGRAAIDAFLQRICAMDFTIRFDDEIVAGDRAAFRFIVTFPDGKLVYEHAMLDTADGKVTRQVEVEAWD
jgi:ketosteroid isomerase-like protein